MKRIACALLCAFLLPAAVFAQQKAPEKPKPRGVFVEPRNPFWDEIRKSTEAAGAATTPPRKAFVADLAGFETPLDLAAYKPVWHNPPVSQGNTNTCWCYSTTSMLESEVYRLSGRKVRLSEAFTTYGEYLERTRRFIRERGRSAVAEGSEANAVTRDWRLYGCVPLEAYPGLLPGQRFADHSKIIAEVKGYLDHVKASNAWDEEAALRTVRAILDHYLGAPPERFTVEGREYTPQTYLREYLRIDLDDYVNVVSYEQQPFGRQVEYEVPDNWWHAADYWNVPLDTFMTILRGALERGYSAALGGDVSEPGRSPEKKVFMIPDFDIPSSAIDDDARQFRFSNGSTTDDHGIHLVGYLQKDGKGWFLVKDSGSSAFNHEPKGYYVLTEEYVKLKMMDFMVHKDAVKGLIDVR
jgi:bleomycin hydrolase